MPGLLDPSVNYRGGVLPLLLRTVTDPIDDVSEYEQLEWATPSLLYDPYKHMALTGAMATGAVPLDPKTATAAMVDAPLVGGLLGAVKGIAPDGAVLGANVFHGGPHRWSPEPGYPHGRPRLDKMGTGEGHQEYGWGHYSAEAPGVATAYREGVIDMGEVHRLNDEMSELVKVMDQDSGPGYRNFMSDKGREAAKRYDELMDAREAVVSAPGTLYKLDIPDADVAKYLDWDKPLSEQPKSVREALANMVSVSAADRKQITKEIKAVKARLNDPWVQRSGGTEMKNKLKEQLQELKAVLLDDSLTGEEFYAGAVAGLGGREAASEALRKAGIPGLKYFDGMSRDGGEGTRNYVTWDQDVLDRSKVLERDGVTLGANKSPTAALPGLLSNAAQGRIRNSRVRDRLSEDQQAAIVKAANAAHAERLDLARAVQHYDDKFDLDQILVDADLAVEVDGFVQDGHVYLDNIDIPAGAKEGDILPISAVKKNAEFFFPDGSVRDFDPNPEFPFRSDDFGVELISLDEDGFADIVLRDRGATESRVLSNMIARDEVGTLEGALGHSDHHARAAAFRKVLDELGIEYDTAGREGISSEYLYVPTKFDADGDAVEELLKIRFSDHTRQSGLHEPADYNIADGGYDDAISALNQIVQELSGSKTEMFSNPITAAIPGLLDDQRGLSDFINYSGSDKRQHRGPYKMRGLLGDVLYEATTPDGFI